MRIWITRASADYSKIARDLDDQRLLAQHREAVGILRIIAGTDEQVHRFRNNSLGDPFRDAHPFVQSVHDPCAEEMTLRGFHHRTPLLIEDFPNFRLGIEYIPEESKVAYDRLDLNQRYILHAKEVLSGKRKHRSDSLRWTFRQIPDWAEQETLIWISKEQEKFRLTS